MKSQILNLRTNALTLVAALLLAACGGDKPEALIASAKEYLAKNDNKAAAIQIKNALQADPNLTEARFLLGTALLGSGDPVGAETEFRKALELKYPQDLVVPQLARALLMRGQYKKLVDEFSKTELTQSAAKASFQTSLATAYMALGKADLFDAALDSALLAEPRYAPALIAKARRLAAEQDMKGAFAVVEDVITKSPKSHEGWKLKGDLLYFDKNRVDEALLAYRKAVEIKPDFLPAHNGIVTLFLQRGNLTEAETQLALLKKVAANDLQTKFLEAQLAYQKKDYKTARELTQQLLKSAPSNPKGLQLAGVTEFQLNSFSQAEVYLSKALLAAPELGLARRVLVMTYLRIGQPAKALATLQPSLNKDDPGPELLSVAGDVYLQNGDIKKAEEYFSRAAKLDPKDGKKRTSLAVAHLMGSNPDAAFGELQNIAASDSGITADLALISAHLQRREFEKALKTIDGLEKKQPSNPLAANLRGKTYVALQDFASARKSFERALVLDSAYSPAITSLAALDVSENKPDDAKKRFEAVLAKDPKNSQALLAIAELKARSGGAKEEVADLIAKAVNANPTEVAPRLLLIDFHLRNKDFKLASSVAQNAVAAIPDSSEILDALGRTQQAAGEFNQAISSFNKLASMQPLSPQPQMRIAGVHIAAKNLDAATQSLRKALDIKPDFLDAQRALISLSLQAGKFQDAMILARAVQKQMPKEAAGYLFEGDINAVQKKWDLAALAYRSGLAQVSSTELAVKAHTAMTVGGKQTEAEKFAATWLKDNPKDAVFTFHLGDSALQKGDLNIAEKNYLDVVRIQPTSGAAYNNLAWIATKLHKEEALAYAEKAITLAPNEPAFMDTIAMVLSEKNEYSKALDWQNKAIALQPKNTGFKLNLAKIYVQGGKKDLARKELDELAKLGDKFPGQVEVARLIKSL